MNCVLCQHPPHRHTHTHTFTKTTGTCLFRIFPSCFISLLLDVWECYVYISSRTNTDARLSSSFSLPEEFYYFTESSGKSRPISRKKKLKKKIGLAKIKTTAKSNYHKRCGTKKNKKKSGRRKITKICRDFFIEVKKQQQQQWKQKKSTILNSFGMCLVVYVTLLYLAVWQARSVDDGGSGGDGGRGDGSSQLAV